MVIGINIDLKIYIRQIICLFFSITELPDYQERMSLNKEVIQQCFLVGHSSYDCSTSISIVGFFLCLSRCLKAHENILQPYIVEELIRICDHSFLLWSVNSPEVKAIKYVYF